MVGDSTHPDIRVRIALDIDTLNRELSDVNKRLRKNFSEAEAMNRESLRKQLKEYQDAQKKIWKTGVFGTGLAVMGGGASDSKGAKASSSMPMIIGDNKSLQTWVRNYKGYANNIIDITDYTIKDIKDAPIKQKPFAGWAMSIMFFGMAMQRAFQSIWTFGTKAFSDIAHSVEGTVTNSDLLQGSIKYLGYTIGNALEPVLGWLIPIVDTVSAWIDKHPKLTRWITIVGIALGSIFFIFGMLKLAFDGFANMMILFWGFDLPKYLEKNGGLFGMLKKEITGTVALFKGMSIGGQLAFLGMLGGIILVLSYIFKMKDAMGGWGEFFKSTARGVLRVITLLAEGFVWLGDMIMKGVVWVLNKVIDLINKILESDIVQWGAKKLGITTGTIKNIDKSQYAFGDAILRKYLDWEESGFLAPSKGYAKGMDFIPEYESLTTTAESIANKPVVNNYYTNVESIEASNKEMLDVINELKKLNNIDVSGAFE